MHLGAEENPVIARVGTSGVAHIKCPECDKTSIASVSRFRLIKKILKIRCSCKVVFFIKTKYPQKSDSAKQIPGKYFDLSTHQHGRITVNSMNSSGVQFSTSGHNSIRKGHRLRLEILVSTPMPVKIEKIAVIRNVKGKKIGGFFLTSQNDEKLRAAGLMS